MICSKCTHESYCDMAQFGDHEPPITTCYKFKEKQQTNADCVRSMTDEELEKWYWWMHKEMMSTTDSRTFVHDWLKQEVESDEL